ncbi:MAG: hypothetical protein IPL19_23360 [Sandaracinaceae bacterium]|nr:hypothetical protein [Sandaracinaceae bacterium]MBK8587876.1 hypothetical protein [Sandaracinaceae bacterium]
MGAETTQASETKGLVGLGVTVMVLGLVGWAAVLTATVRIPSPAHETVFVDATGRELDDAFHCHGTVVVDDGDVWMSCYPDLVAEPSLTRFDVRTGRATLVGELPEVASGLSGGIVGPDGTRVFLVANSLVEVRDGRLSTLGSAASPIGLAAVNDGVEVVMRGATPRVARFVGGRRVNERSLSLGDLRSEQVEAAPVRAYHDGRAWHVLVATYPRTAPALPVAVTLQDQGEDGSQREVGRVQWGEDSMYRSDAGEVLLSMGQLLAGNVVTTQLGLREVQILGVDGLTTVALPDAPMLSVPVVYMSDGPHARVALTDMRERDVWLDGVVLTRTTEDGRFVSLHTEGRRGPVVASEFWLTPGFRVVSEASGGATLLGSLGGSYIQIGADLARTDPLSFVQRLRRLFVVDRAKRNADIVGVHLARFAIIPFMLLGPLVGALVLRLRGRAVLRRWLAVGWLVLAIAGAYPFSYFLRFYF